MNINRRLYRGGRPNALAKFMNRAWACLYSLGVAPDYLVTLELPGRLSGKAVRFPLVLTIVDGERYLVSMLGEQTNWIKNLLAAGNEATLLHGRRERVRLIAVAAEKRAPILKAYLRIAPGARPHIPVHKDAPLADFAAVADRYPVFRVETLA